MTQQTKVVLFGLGMLSSVIAASALNNPYVYNSWVPSWNYYFTQQQQQQQQQQAQAAYSQQFLAPHLNTRSYFHPESGGVQFLVQGKASSGLPAPKFDAALEVEKPYVYGHKVVESYPHDKDAFTQGLFVHKGIMYESTGLYGKSSVRKVDVKTGKVLQMSKYSDKIFGEGIAMHSDGKIYGLSWKEREAFRIDPETLRVEKEFQIPNEISQGWGITSDGTNLIVTDSTQKLHFLNSDFQHLRSLTIEDKHQGKEVPYVNEIEFIGNKIYGNVYGLDHLVVINPADGTVENWIDCRGLWKGGPRGQNQVFNGVAFDSEEKKMYVTGKNWPNLYEIELVQAS